MVKVWGVRLLGCRVGKAFVTQMMLVPSTSGYRMRIGEGLLDRADGGSTMANPRFGADFDGSTTRTR
jgi:hypothetical protein